MTAARVATDQLTKALINAAARGIRPRCGDYEVNHYGLSEHEGERARLCRGCPVIRPFHKATAICSGSKFKPARPRWSAPPKPIKCWSTARSLPR
jgi:hypothetical protein